MDTASSAPIGPRALIRSGLVTTDIVAVPLLTMAFGLVVCFAAASVASAAGGLYLILPLGLPPYFPEFPVTARILTGLSLLAFAAALAVCALFLWQLFRSAWLAFWTWHNAAWQSLLPRDSQRSAGIGSAWGAFRVRIRLSGWVFLGLLAISFAVMMLLAGGPFWHVWGWFT